MLKEITRNFKVSIAIRHATGIFSDFSVQNMKFFRLCCLWLLSVSFFLFFFDAPAALGKAPLSEIDIEELYNQGTEYFHQATEISEADPVAASDLYAKSLLRFERLVEEGNVTSGKLFYNIGNIHFLLDDMGRAILNYRRAQQYIPNDSNLAKNLAYARSMRRDKLDIQDRDKILQTLFFFHYDLGTKTRVIIFAVFYTAFWAFVSIRIFSKRPFTTWGLSVTLLFSLLFASSLFMEDRQSGIVRDGVILEPEVIGRQGDAESYQPSFEAPLHGGTEFTLLENRGAWWRIELADGRSSWIAAKSGELVKRR